MFYIECDTSGVKLGETDDLTEAIRIAQKDRRYGKYSTNSVYNEENERIVQTHGLPQFPNWIREDYRCK